MNQPLASFIISLVIILPMITFWLRMFQDMTHNDNLPNEAKNNWTLAFVFGNVFAATFYFATEIEKVENAADAAKRSKIRRDLRILVVGSVLTLILTIAISFIHR
jgi:amino acid transporter